MPDNTGSLSAKIVKNQQLLQSNLAKLTEKTFVFEEKEELHKNLLTIAKQIQSTCGKLPPQTLTNKETGTSKNYLSIIKDLFSDDVSNEVENSYISVLAQTDLLGSYEDWLEN